MYRVSRADGGASSGLELIVHINPEALAEGINPFTHGSAVHTDVMKTQALQAGPRQVRLRRGVRRRAPRRGEVAGQGAHVLVPHRAASLGPEEQRPELWRLYNTRKRKGESIRVFPLSNWTELDIWQYIHLENIPIVPLYYAKERPVVVRDGTLIMVDDDRMPLLPGEEPR